jgi:hypothetical protein
MDLSLTQATPLTCPSCEGIVILIHEEWKGDRGERPEYQETFGTWRIWFMCTACEAEFSLDLQQTRQGVSLQLRPDEDEADQT